MSLHDTDFYAWASQTSFLLKERQFEQVNWEMVIEEIESLGKSDRDQLTSSLKILISHFLKWHYQPDKRSKSWLDSIFRARENIDEYFEDSRSLQQFLSDEWVHKAYNRALEE